MDALGAAMSALKTNDVPLTDHVYPLDLFAAAKASSRPLYVSAPMVRYSKLAFRQTLAHYAVDLVFSPMILAKEFNRSSHARNADFSLSPTPFSPPTIVQLAAACPVEFARAAEMLLEYCSGVDLNCGCPQSWAAGEGVGACLMGDPERVVRMVKAGRGVVERGGWEGRRTVSVKIRIHRDLEQTRRFIEMVQDAGVDFITIHGRLKSTRSSEPVNVAAIAHLRRFVSVPLLFNGDIESRSKAHAIAATTRVDGVMSARDILHNPSLFSGSDACTWEAVEVFLNYCVKAPLPYKLVVHHLVVMTEGGRSGSPGLLQGAHGVRGKVEPLLTKGERWRLVEGCRDLLDVIDLLDEIRGVRRL